LHAIGSVLGIFIICSLLDMLRIRLVEVHFLKWIEKKLPLWKLHYNKIEEWFAKKVGIERGMEMKDVYTGGNRE